MLIDAYADALNLARSRSLEALRLIELAGELVAAGQVQLAAILYRTWLDHNADSPVVHAIHFNNGVVLSSLGDVPAAVGAFEQAIAARPDFFPPYVNLGGLLERTGQPREGVLKWMQAVNQLPSVTGENINFKVGALKQIGRVLELYNLDEPGETALAQAIDLDPTRWDVVQHWLALRQRQCKWPVVTPLPRMSRAALTDGFSALTLAAHTDDPFLLLGNAYKYCKSHIGEPAISFAERHTQRHDGAGGPLKIGYLSSDLRDHAVGHLTAEIYGLHDRTKVAVSAYYCGGIKADDPMHRHIKGSCDHWIDLGGLTDEAAAQRICDDGIQVLVDLNGYTNGAQTKVLAMRPAPIIVNWLGFPGTMGTPYHDYIIADDFVIPRESEIYYSEKVVRIPCYQPNNRRRVVSERGITRRDAGLPEDAVVYCCFNGAHKITPHTFERWIAILRQVPGSVLWLLDNAESTNQRLRDAAAQGGIAPERLVFAPKMPNADHLARYILADLFLDSAPYGAHTTSSDALWMGVPLVTLVGRSFASRVCGSLLTAAGLPELVCETPDQFVALAVALGRDPGRRNGYRRRLAETRDTCVLFDTPLLVARLEALYAEMWSAWSAGYRHRPDLVNLEVYNDIGVELTAEGDELWSAAEYRARYERKLAEKDRFWNLPLDSRLWTPETRRRLGKTGGSADR